MRSRCEEERERERERESEGERGGGRERERDTSTGAALSWYKTSSSDIKWYDRRRATRWATNLSS
jgi:hypothetical protein